MTPRLDALVAISKKLPLEIWLLNLKQIIHFMSSKSDF